MFSRKMTDSSRLVMLCLWLVFFAGGQAVAGAGGQFFHAQDNDELLHQSTDNSMKLREMYISALKNKDLQLMGRILTDDADAYTTSNGYQKSAFDFFNQLFVNSASIEIKDVRHYVHYKNTDEDTAVMSDPLRAVSGFKLRVISHKGAVSMWDLYMDEFKFTDLNGVNPRIRQIIMMNNNYYRKDNRKVH